MYLRPDDLLKHGGCYPGYSFMQRYYPDGGELVDIMKHKYVTPHFLHWGFLELDTNDEEKALYYKLLNIHVEKPHTVHSCDNVIDSMYIYYSSNVCDSEVVKNSKEIRNSSYISASEEVEGSKYLFESEFVYDSDYIYRGKNITSCSNLCEVDYAINSRSIYASKHTIDCGWVRNSENLTNCEFCADCSDLKNGLFCCGTSGEYLLFNKPIDQRQFEVIQRQLHSILNGWKMELTTHWGDSDFIAPNPSKNVNYIKQYSSLPDKFWKWVQTLPGYDNMLMYQITFQPQLLD